MQVSYHSLLDKMTEKLEAAKRESSDGKIREYVQAIKTLCEVMLDEGQLQDESSPSVGVKQAKKRRMASEYLDLDDEFHDSDSILDF